MTTVTELAKTLENKLGNPTSFRSISTRVLLRTGVSLRDPAPEQDRDAQVVTRLRQVLTEMGYQM